MKYFTFLKDNLSGKNRCTRTTFAPKKKKTISWVNVCLSPSDLKHKIFVGFIQLF